MEAIGTHYINFFWSQPELPELAINCLKSFQAHGHTCRVWAYDEITNLPESVNRADANQIMPFDETISIRNFSDIFRLKMLIAVGGWWSDLDNYCIRALDIKGKYVFPRYGRSINNNILKAPKNTKLFTEILKNEQKYNFEKLEEYINKHKLSKYVYDDKYFNPLRTNLTGEPVAETYTVHLFASNNNKTSILKTIEKWKKLPEQKNQLS
ncbi:MAG: hypothetical protein A2W90_02610 [Bacteroidetes bacterium GWF2_42_66]|nr:MAG: hypothetical protein A2W92_19650 [Bacteroidetes bacterium GWA2_42_15]OFY01243.1 MAG: hypothetical protein A2W89_16095 [Bacteroidetes bacterium GWE2_42_39]OFY42086.1 MAG: hypothetical protein A2W90_02610 [Bacteroidetes bacterium GWF2_42_66]HBL77711.1 hypothetical protein [Prolixibacteraceae bacterium]HCB62840.1 hypothetical protein [Bacteroidales bacterium]